MKRRAFLRTGMAGFGSILLMPSCLSRSSHYRFFTDSEASCLIALCETIIPADEHGGGATEAGVIHYIDRQLIAVFTYDQLMYQQGIAAVQEYCLDKHQKRFEELETSVQEQFLEEMEASALDAAVWTGPGQRAFFNLIRDHSMQGFYGSPRHGGNKNYMSYQMMGLDYPLVIGRNHYAHLKEGDG